MIGCFSSSQPTGAIASKPETSKPVCAPVLPIELTALVVDDNPIVLKCTAEMLKELGYRTHTAGEGSKALGHLRQSPCDLLLTDYEMPEVNGWELGQKARTLSLDMRIIIMTGNCQADVAHLMSDRHIDAWLFKPFRLEHLAEMLVSLGLPVGFARRARAAEKAEIRA